MTEIKAALIQLKEIAAKAFEEIKGEIIKKKFNRELKLKNRKSFSGNHTFKCDSLQHPCSFQKIG